jgi:L-asparaginase II
MRYLLGVTYAGGDVLAEVNRSGFTEGFHRGSVVILGPDGTIRTAVGDITGPIFPRSSIKPMQAVGMLRAGLKLADPADLALVSASHSGEDMHITRVRTLLASGGFTPSDLRTPPDLPLGNAASRELLQAGGQPQPIFMNCSGKHAGMLLTCAIAGWPIDDYRDPSHPLQQHLQAAVADIAGEPIAAVGIDGCGAPALAISLTGLARAFLRHVDAAPDTDERLVADAMRAYPALVSGTGADDDRLMRGVPGLLSKGGAEGVIAVALPGVGAVALKIDDGAMRARMPVLVAALRKLGCDAPVLAELAESVLLGGGVPVGAVRCVAPALLA